MVAYLVFVMTVAPSSLFRLRSTRTEPSFFFVMIVDGLGGAGFWPAYCLALEESYEVDRLFGVVPLIAFPLEAKFLAAEASNERDRVLGTALPLLTAG